MRARSALPPLASLRPPPPPVSRPRRFAPRPTLTTESAGQDLDWSTYLQLRRSKRRYGLLASIPTTFAGFSIGAGYFATLESDPGELIMGIEPIYACVPLSC